MYCSIIIPVLNEADGIAEFLQHLQTFRKAGHEIVVVDGGSTDSTPQLAKPYADKLVQTSSGRARQMNAGVHVADGEVLVFVHADTFLPGSAMQDIKQGLEKSKKVWGRFAVRLSGHQFLFRIIELMMNMRSCLTGVATGDQVIFIKRDVFSEAGYFDDMPLMEDVAMSKKLKGISRPCCLSSKVCTSSRRWEQHGIIRTVFLMWILRLRYWLGTSPDILVQHYYKKKYD